MDKIIPLANPRIGSAEEFSQVLIRISSGLSPARL